ASDDRVASALAQAELDLRDASEIVLRGTAVGDPRLRPGVAVEIQNLASGLVGSYVLTEVRHTIDRERGFLSEISSAPPQPPARHAGATLTVGIVTSVDDPDRLGRVQVRLPTFGDVDCGWIGVVSVAAGRSKGIVALPDVDDHVLALLAPEDPGRAVVRGGLFGAAGADAAFLSRRTPSKNRSVAAPTSARRSNPASRRCPSSSATRCSSKWTTRRSVSTRSSASPTARRREPSSTTSGAPDRRS